MTEQRLITIAGHEFPVSQPYAEGHTITEAEAKALNQVRAENIRNNMASRVKVAMGKEPSDEVNPSTIADIVAAYDADYEFTLASVGGGRRPTDPVDLEALKIARGIIADFAKSRNITVKAIREAQGEDAYNDKLAEIAGRDEVRKEAARRVKARNAQVEASAADLGLDDLMAGEEAA